MMRVCICTKKEKGKYELSRLRAGIIGLCLIVSISTVFSVLHGEAYVLYVLIPALLCVSTVAVYKIMSGHEFGCALRRGLLALINSVTSPF